MASDQLRKKWGTVFMGEREATVEQLDAMQEPLRRERMQQQQQEDYFDRVRAKAEERAREILGAAYAERQKVLDEARAEAHELNKRLTRESEAIKAQAQEERNQTQAELAQAQALRQEAQTLREEGRADGFQAGMDQAGQELKEFRAEIGQALGTVLYALDSQRHAICASWREQLAHLTQEAVTAGTGWVLEKEHKKILQSLVFEALNLLEDRATVTLRVHPDDEDTVSDMFMAARERVPELQQWIVNGDPSVQRGGLLAESVSGSVDCRRELYTELVNSVLSCLTLGPDQNDQRHGEAVSQLVRQEAERIAAMSPEPEQPSAHGAHEDAHAEQQDAAGYDEQPASVAHADPLDVDLPAELLEGAKDNLPPDPATNLPADMAGDMAADEAAHVADAAANVAADDLTGKTAAAPQAQDRQDQALPSTDEPALPEDHQGPIPDTEALMVEEPEWPAAAPGSAVGPAPGSDFGSERGGPPISSDPDSSSTAAPDVQAGLSALAADGQQSEDRAFAAPAQEAEPAHGAAPAPFPAAEEHAGQEHVGQEMTPAAKVRPSVQAENPTLAELEDELFPLEAEAEENGLMEHLSPQSVAPLDVSGFSGPGSPVDPEDHEEHDIFSQGGFLPGADKGR